MSPITPTDLNVIIAKLKAIRPSSRTQLYIATYHLLHAAVTQIINTHNTNSVIFIFQLASGKYLLKTEYGNGCATSKEVDWYEHVASEISDLTPLRYASYRNDSFAFVLLAYIQGFHTVDQAVFDSHETNSDVISCLKESMNRNTTLFMKSKPTRASREDIESHFITKYRQRMREADNFLYLRQLIEAPSLVLNGKPTPTPRSYIQYILNNTALHDFLTPELTGTIHGDLHCSNILIKDSEMYFIDPKGISRLPIEYDYGKLLHSVHGGYGLILRKRYALTMTRDKSYVLNLALPAVYVESFWGIMHTLTDRVFLSSMYAEALHFATMLPHHAKEREETIVLFLRCMQIFEELFQKLNVSINVNYAQKPS